MNSIQMVDLFHQYEKIKSEIDDSIAEVLRNTDFINGKAVKQFERELSQFMGCKYVVGCANGTDALQIALMALGLQRGDEVITSPFTFVSTVEVIALLGLRPVFADIEEDYFSLRPESISEEITEKTRCIIPVHLFGTACDMQSIMRLAESHRLSVIEDNAQSIGCETQMDNEGKEKTGTIGQIGTLSFYPTKNLSCYGDGGAITTNDEYLFNKIRQIANHGSEKKYYHETVGVNSRLDSLQAAILRVKLEQLNSYSLARREAANTYTQFLHNTGDIILPLAPPYATHVYHQYTIRTQYRDALKEYLQKHNIPSMIYYPVPLHLQKAYEYLGYKAGDMPVSEKMSREVLSLPMHTELEENQIEYICATIKNFFNNRV